MIRRASYSDIQAIESILSNVIEWMTANDIANSWTLENVKWDALSKNYSIEDFYLYSIDNKPVACIAITDVDQKYWPDSLRGEALYIHKLAVKREYAGHKISHQLIMYCLDMATKRNIKKVRLDCNANRMKLRELYEKEGFSNIKLYDSNSNSKMALYQYDLV